jgi:hypothetical protein
MNTRTSTSVIVAALVAFGAFATAAVLFVAGDAATERLGLLFALFGTIVAALIAALRSDHAATQTNGGLDRRIEDAVTAAMRARRSTDRVIVTEEPAKPAEGPG